MISTGCQSITYVVFDLSSVVFVLLYCKIYGFYISAWDRPGIIPCYLLNCTALRWVCQRPSHFIKDLLSSTKKMLEPSCSARDQFECCDVLFQICFDSHNMSILPNVAPRYKYIALVSDNTLFLIFMLLKSKYTCICNNTLRSTNAKLHYACVWN